MLRLYQGANYIEVESIVGPLEENKECITRFTTDLATEGLLHSDNNGYHMLVRKSHIEQQGMEKEDPIAIAARYYPMVYSTFLKDQENDLQLTVLAERSHGVSSQRSG